MYVILFYFIIAFQHNDAASNIYLINKLPMHDTEE